MKTGKSKLPFNVLRGRGKDTASLKHVQGVIVKGMFRAQRRSLRNTKCDSIYIWQLLENTVEKISCKVDRVPSPGSQNQISQSGWPKKHIFFHQPGAWESVFKASIQLPYLEACGWPSSWSHAVLLYVFLLLNQLFLSKHLTYWASVHP